VLKGNEHIAEWVPLMAEKLLATWRKLASGRPGAIDAARNELGLFEGGGRRAVTVAAI
jgi:hypothetical protein